MGNSIKTIGRNRGSKAALTAADIRLMRQVVKRNDALAYMGESLAPSICGHQDVKEAILLLLAGGGFTTFVAGAFFGDCLAGVQSFP